MTPDETRAWFADWLDALNRRDLEGIRSRLTPDVRRVQRPRGADAWIADLEERFDAFPDLQWKRIALVIEGDRVAAHLRARGTHRRAFRGVVPTGRHVNVAEFAFFRLTGGRIAEAAGSADDEVLLAAVSG